MRKMAWTRAQQKPTAEVSGLLLTHHMIARPLQYQLLPRATWVAPTQLQHLMDWAAVQIVENRNFYWRAVLAECRYISNAFLSFHGTEQSQPDIEDVLALSRKMKIVG